MNRPRPTEGNTALQPMAPLPPTNGWREVTWLSLGITKNAAGEGSRFADNRLHAFRDLAANLMKEHNGRPWPGSDEEWVFETAGGTEDATIAAMEVLHRARRANVEAEETWLDVRIAIHVGRLEIV